MGRSFIKSFRVLEHCRSKQKITILMWLRYSLYWTLHFIRYDSLRIWESASVVHHLMMRNVWLDDRSSKINNQKSFSNSLKSMEMPGVIVISKTYKVLFKTINTQYRAHTFIPKKLWNWIFFCSFLNWQFYWQEIQFFSVFKFGETLFVRKNSFKFIWNRICLYNIELYNELSDLWNCWVWSKVVAIKYCVNHEYAFLSDAAKPVTSKPSVVLSWSTFYRIQFGASI